jgi:hypothetical protein
VQSKEKDSIKAFISYSHDDEEHCKRVLALSNQLKKEDEVDCSIDEDIKGTPKGGWALWTEKKIIQADYVLLICTETYYKRFYQEEDLGEGRGVIWEGRIIRNIIYDSPDEKNKFLPVIFTDSDLDFIPIILKDNSYYVLYKDYDKLYGVLTSKPKVITEMLGHTQSYPLVNRETEFNENNSLIINPDPKEELLIQFLKKKLDYDFALSPIYTPVKIQKSLERCDDRIKETLDKCDRILYSSLEIDKMLFNFTEEALQQALQNIPLEYKLDWDGSNLNKGPCISFLATPIQVGTIVVLQEMVRKYKLKIRIDGTCDNGIEQANKLSDNDEFDFLIMPDYCFYKAVENGGSKAVYYRQMYPCILQEQYFLGKEIDFKKPGMVYGLANGSPEEQLRMNVFPGNFEINTDHTIWELIKFCSGFSGDEGLIIWEPFASVLADRFNLKWGYKHNTIHSIFCHQRHNRGNNFKFLEAFDILFRNTWYEIKDMNKLDESYLKLVNDPTFMSAFKRSVKLDYLELIGQQNS